MSKRLPLKNYLDVIFSLHCRRPGRIDTEFYTNKLVSWCTQALQTPVVCRNNNRHSPLVVYGENYISLEIEIAIRYLYPRLGELTVFRQTLFILTMLKIKFDISVGNHIISLWKLNPGGLGGYYQWRIQDFMTLLADHIVDSDVQPLGESCDYTQVYVSNCTSQKVRPVVTK